MKTKVDRKYNRRNLIDISALVQDIDCFAFYGSILGIVREGDVIKNDDDIDFLVNIEHKETLLDTLKKSKLNLKLDNPLNKLSPYFFQANRIIDGTTTCIDFYFYTDAPDKDYIIEKWNFFAKPKDKKYEIHIPKNIIYPLASLDFHGQQVKVPANGEKVCEYLYGKSWRTPQQKGTQYKIEIVNNKPNFLTSKHFDINKLSEEDKQLTLTLRQLDADIANLQKVVINMQERKRILSTLLFSRLKDEMTRDNNKSGKA